jgi:hypothetical protein
MKQQDILKRVDYLLNLDSDDLQEVVSGTVSLLTRVYGPKTPQLDSFHASTAIFLTHGNLYGSRAQQVIEAVHGALKNLKGEIEAGLTGNLKQQIAGEVLTDFIQLARSVLDEQGDGAKNVGAVLAAAAFEDTIRRMGQDLAGVVGQDDLSNVLTKLKDAGVIHSPQFGIAQSYLSFRNHALHANFDKIQRESIHSVLGFVEQLLQKHFS